MAKVKPPKSMIPSNLRSAGGESLAVTLPIQMVRSQSLVKDQPVMIEEREIDDKIGIFIVPIRETPAEGGE